jgi:hypothetical protein
VRRPVLLARRAHTETSTQTHRRRRTVHAVTETMHESSNSIVDTPSGPPCKIRHTCTASVLQGEVSIHTALPVRHIIHTGDNTPSYSGNPGVNGVSDRKGCLTTGSQYTHTRSSKGISIRIYTLRCKMCDIHTAAGLQGYSYNTLRSYSSSHLVTPKGYLCVYIYTLCINKYPFGVTPGQAFGGGCC